MIDADIPRGLYLRRLVVMLTLNFASVLAMTSPLWLTTAYHWSQTYWTIALDPNATPEQTAARMHLYRTPPFHEAARIDAGLAALPYVAWVLVLYLVHKAYMRRRGRAGDLETWAAAGRCRLAYFLCWPIPFFVPLVVWFLQVSFPAGRQRRWVNDLLNDARYWFVAAWRPTTVVLVAAGLWLAVRRTRGNIRRLRRDALEPGSSADVPGASGE